MSGNECQDGHKLEPRYSTKDGWISVNETDMFFKWSKARPVRQQTYHGDVCVKCGKFFEKPQ